MKIALAAFLVASAVAAHAMPAAEKTFDSPHHDYQVAYPDYLTVIPGSPPGLQLLKVSTPNGIMPQLTVDGNITYPRTISGIVGMLIFGVEVYPASVSVPSLSEITSMVARRQLLLQQNDNVEGSLTSADVDWARMSVGGARQRTR